MEELIKLKKEHLKSKNNQKLEFEIRKLESMIDKEIYKLYGITPEEQKIIEESLK